MYCRKTPSHTDFNNTCDVINRFLKTIPISDFNSFYKLENQLTGMTLSQKSKQTKISDYFTSK